MKQLEHVFSEQNIEALVREQEWKYEYAGTDWRDGMLIGNGSLGALGYAPGAMEWVVNKTDIFDGRVPDCDMLPHDEVMRRVEESQTKSSAFLSEEEQEKEHYELRSVSAFIFRLHYGNGELGWNAPAFPKISQNLSLYEGKLVMKADAHFVHSFVTSFIPHGKNLFLLRVDGCAISDWSHTLELYRPHHNDMPEPVWENGAAGEVSFLQSLPGNIGSYAVSVKMVPRKPERKRVCYRLPKDFCFDSRKNELSTAECRGNHAVIRQSGDVDIFISVYTSYESETPLESAKREVLEATQCGFDKLESEHRRWWREYWNKSAVNFGVYREFERYWYFSLYELACSYGKAPMPALSGMAYGPLNETTPGVSACNYVHDQNVQIPIMPLPNVNHLELTEVFADSYLRAAEELKKHTKALFGKTGGNGLFIPLVANQNCRELPSGEYRYTLCGGAYVGLMLCKIWDYGRNFRYMREKLYPLLCELIRFYTDNLLQKDEAGQYHMDWSVPPEIFTFTKDDTATLSMLKTCMETALDFAERENMILEEKEYWKDILEHYPTLAKRADGAWWGGCDIPEEHFCFGTHLLYPFFPSAAYLTEKDRETTKKTLSYIDENALERSYAGDDGWHFVHDWSFLLYEMTRLRMGEGKRAWESLRKFLKNFAKPNGLFAHNSVMIFPSSVTENNHNICKPKEKVTADITTAPEWYGSGKCATPHEKAKRMIAPVIEGNSIFLLLATETLLQSYDGMIRVFPAVPEDFEGGFFRLRTRGGFFVSATLQSGICRVRIESEHGGRFYLESQKYHLASEGCNSVSTEQKGIYLTADLKAGQSADFISVF